MNFSTQETSAMKRLNEYNAHNMTLWVINKAILQAQETEISREQEAKIIAIELIDYIKHLVSNNMAPVFFNSFYTP
jgi:hypothetical protein